MSPILDVATRMWACTSKRVVYVYELEGNLKIWSTMEELNNVSKDLMEIIQREEELQQSRRKCIVEGWLDAVRAMGAEMEKIL